MSESFWLLPFFFVAIAAGFFLGRRESKRRQRRRMASLSKDYVALSLIHISEPTRPY